MSPQEAVRFMRENNIAHLKLENGIEITLGSAPDTAALPKADPTEEKKMNEIGTGGMSRRQQIELFGQVFESDFPKAVK